MFLDVLAWIVVDVLGTFICVLAVLLFGIPFLFIVASAVVVAALDWALNRVINR